MSVATCEMRKDLKEKFSDGFFSDEAFIEPDKRYECKYINDEQFLVKTDNEWRAAYTIDFDF